jgi:hypothetical protein
MAEKIKNFQDLRIWKIGIEVVKDIYILSKKFPKDRVIWVNFSNETFSNFDTVKYC